LLAVAGVVSDNPWPPKLLIKAMDRITDSPALTDLVKKLIEMDDGQVQKILKVVRKW